MMRNEKILLLILSLLLIVGNGVPNDHLCLFQFSLFPQGKFLRGLETSIEVLNQAESSHSDMG